LEYKCPFFSFSSALHCLLVFLHAPTILIPMTR
jgi:hypothetical protein